MEISNDGYHIKVKYAGDIAFTDDETGIKSISPGGCIKYWKNGRKLIAESDKDGTIAYQLYDGDNNVSPNEERGKKFVALVIKDLINLGFDAKNRVDRIYRKGGAAAVLDEIDYLKNDFVRRTYFERLLESKYLTPAEMNETAKSIGVALSADYEKSELLKKFADDYMASPQTSQAYLQAVKSINGDYEKASTLEAIVKQPLTKGQLGQVLVITNTIGGDYEKANVLKQIVEKEGLGPDNCDKLLEVTNAIGGDYEKAGVLTELVENDSIPEESFGRLLLVATHIGGDYEKAGVFKKITEQNIATEGEWLSLINAATQINAAYEKSGVLVEIAKKMPRGEKVMAAYMEAAKTINSDYEYAQAVKATEQ
jgi:hypothetical protein